ncbi:MAG: 16S rRNA (uracil(1498)-N(3))-methyltransferase [Erysipelotrichaceae bacterium]|nr:16S rRNA (uracil(1498)-N(3))-methyltransferase [Erysipelotrichaceae bacterium]
MQQFFVNELIENNELVSLDADVLYQLKKVLRVNNGYTFRLVDNDSNVYLCHFENNHARIINKIIENNELDTNITVILSLIKNDKMDFAIQKLCELGVKRIVPYKAYRSVVKEGKATNKIDRFKKIAKEACEQSHRNIIPEITDFINIKEIKNYMNDINVIAYENEDNIVNNFKCNSITILIGPEGGFDEKELEIIKNLGFNSISLGKRILRAETAAIYLTSLIVGDNQ